MNYNSINDINKKEKHKLSYINNNSTDCLNPEYFNPLINYKNEDKNKNKKIKKK